MKRKYKGTGGERRVVIFTILFMLGIALFVILVISDRDRRQCDSYKYPEITNSSTEGDLWLAEDGKCCYYPLRKERACVPLRDP